MEASLIAALPKHARADTQDQGLRPEFVVPLNTAGSMFLAQVRWGAYESTLIVLDAQGMVLSSAQLELRSIDIGLADILGDEGLEVVAWVIEGTAMSTFPQTWVFYRVSAKGELVAVTSVAESLGSGSKCVRYDYVNELEMPAKGRLVITNVYRGHGVAEFSDPSGTPGTPASAPTEKPKAGPTGSFELIWNEPSDEFDVVARPPQPSDPTRSGCDSPNRPSRRGGEDPFQL